MKQISNGIGVRPARARLTAPVRGKSQARAAKAAGTVTSKGNQLGKRKRLR